MAEDVAPTDRSEPSGPLLSRPPDAGLTSPFGSVDGTSLYRRPGSEAPPPTVPPDLGTPDLGTPAPTLPEPPPGPAVGTSPFAAARAAVGAPPVASPVPPPGVPPTPPPPSAAPPVASWLPPPPQPPAWVPPGARVPPDGGGAAWAPASGPLPASPSRPIGPLALGVGALVAVALVAVAVIAFGIVRSDRPAAVAPPPAEQVGPSDATDPSGPSDTSGPLAWDPRIEPIATWVATERGLDFHHPVEVVLQSEEEYLDRASGVSGLEEGAVDDVEDALALLRALGLVEGEVDLDDSLRAVASEGTLAYYDPPTETVYVRGTELTPHVRVTLAHELTHVLQDQHFDLERVADPDFDRSEELRAIAEGDAGRIEEAYVADVLTTPERDEYQDASDASVEEAEAALADVPPILLLLVAAPYSLGDTYLRYLEVTADGDPGDSYDDALEDPPSAQGLLDPSSHGTDRSDPIEVTVEAPAGAEVIDEGTVDPLTWYLLLASRDTAGAAGAALEVVDGWGGDAAVSYRLDGQVCAAMAVVGDDAPATDRLFFALAGWADDAPGGSATVTRNGDTVEVHACDPGVEAAEVGALGPDLLAVPVVRAGLEASMIESGSTPEEARCVSTGILGAFTIEDIGDADPSPAVVRRARELMATCAG